MAEDLILDRFAVGNRRDGAIDQKIEISLDITKANEMRMTAQCSRLALFMTISSMAVRGATDVLDDFHQRVVAMLVQQGFDEQASDEVFDDLVAKYRTGASPFRRKVHLLYPDGADEER
ncbi:hypothetical protein LJR255_002389 [Pararhizobium sp. LjRoot255]|uniref:hypothetical protein n=1 Tax=Pararhizobium sp. LjRoot255 TaxID=3342298 RepID=UPI003ECFB6E5